MSQPELRRRMRGSDAMFLYFERTEMPLHIGCVAILDGPFDDHSEQVFATRLPEIPRYRQRVMFSPMNLTHPSWEDDPEFDIRNHIHRVTLEPPGDERQLSELSGRVFTTLLDRNQPLWDLTVVDGLEGGRSALIVRVHHCMVDGVSGVGLVKIMFDPSREPRRVEARPYSPPPLPDSRQLLAEGLAALVPEAAERLIGANLTLLRMLQGFTGEGGRSGLQDLLAVAPELLRPAERLPFNGPCSGVRGHCWTSSPFGEARAIRAALGGTINDVILTIVTGAVSRYVTAHREPVSGRFVRMMVPVNLRSDDPRGGVGNEISMLPISIPLDVGDAAERMRVVSMRSAAMKSAHIADVVALIGTWLGWIPANFQHSLAALAFLPQPVRIVNMVCTNVPGPMVPLYANGRELLTYYPHVPCGSDVGISVAVSSYNQNLYYGVTYDAQAAPDGELFRDFLIESYEELRDAAGVRPAAAPQQKPAAPPAVETPNEEAAAGEGVPAPGTTENLTPHSAPEPPAARPESVPADVIAGSAAELSPAAAPAPPRAGSKNGAAQTAGPGKQKPRRQKRRGQRPAKTAGAN
jgi:WS/DGAT/MGAT family acyltransferase